MLGRQPDRPVASRPPSAGSWGAGPLSGLWGSDARSSTAAERRAHAPAWTQAALTQSRPVRAPAGGRRGRAPATSVAPGAGGDVAPAARGEGRERMPIGSRRVGTVAGGAGRGRGAARRGLGAEPTWGVKGRQERIWPPARSAEDSTMQEPYWPCLDPTGLHKLAFKSRPAIQTGPTCKIDFTIWHFRFHNLTS